MRCMMLDTNVFNDLIDNRVSRDAFTDHRIIATHVQIDELQKTSDESRRCRMVELFSQIVEEFRPTSSAVWDVSRWDQANWGDSTRYQRMLTRLIELDKKSGKKIRPPNQQRDVLIAETSLYLGCTFVSRDSNLIAVVVEEGGRVLPTTPPSPPIP